MLNTGVESTPTLIVGVGVNLVFCFDAVFTD